MSTELTTLIAAAHQALLDAREAATEARELDRLLRQLEPLGGVASQALEGLSLPFRQTFVDVTLSVGTRALSHELRDDLRVCVTALRTMARHLAAPASTRPLGVEDLDLRYSRVDLAAHLRSLVDPFQALAASRAIRLELSVPAEQPCTVDPRKIETVVLNLLFNAFKYAPLNSRVVVRLDASAAGDEVSFSISDDGPPVPEAEWQAIFDRARQLDRNVFPPQGALGFNLGVSLAYCRLHGGTLSLRSTGDAGCSFEARWSMHAPRGAVLTRSAPPDAAFARTVAEVAARELEAEAGLGASAVDRERPTVLVVEGARALHRALVECMRESFNTLSAFDGQQGLALATQASPDLILADTTTPPLDAGAFVRAVRAAPSLERVPLLLLAAPDDASVVHLLEAGAQDLLRKPFLLQEVRSRVSGLVAAKRARDILNDALGHRDADLIRLANDIRAQQKSLQSTVEELRAARETAERASKVKSNFLRMISHELATPIAALQLHVQALKKGPLPALPRHVEEGLSRTHRVSRRLHHLVDTMAEWARAESGRFRPAVSNVDVSALMKEVLEEVRSYASEKGVTLNFVRGPPPGSLSSDRRVVYLILIDLISFVIQNVASGGIDVSVAQAVAGLRVHVRDPGPRIVGEQRTDLFSPLESIADLRWRSGHGSGLGLHVVRDLAHAIHGELQLDGNFPGPGNLFVLSLPPLAATTADIEVTALPLGVGAAGSVAVAAARRSARRGLHRSARGHP